MTVVVDSVETIVLQVVAEYFNTTAENIKPEQRLTKQFGFDSLNMTELLLRIEERLELEYTPEAAVEQMKTVGDMVEYFKGVAVAA